MYADVHERKRTVPLTGDRARARAHPGGRAPDPAKDAAILRAARERFFERGFLATSIEEVAARASVSKVTVYKRFATKEALFEATVKAEMADMVAALEQALEGEGPLADRLDGFGLVLLRFLFSPRHLSLDRMLRRDFVHTPELARRFYDLGPGHCRARVGVVLARAAAAGEIEIDDPLLAAADLFGLWRGFLEKELELGVVPGVDEAGLRRRVERGTRLFLRMARPAGLEPAT